MASESPAIGIDLGTTNSCVAVWRNGRAEVIPNELGNRSTPSCVAFSVEELYVGEGALNQAAFNLASTIYDCKRFIGRQFNDQSVQEDKKMLPFKIIQGPNDRVIVGINHKGVDKQVVPELISSIVLTKMKEIAEAYLGIQVMNAVITVPSYFSSSQRQATKDAGVIAGFENIGIISESTAAAIGYGVDKMMGEPNGKNVLIFDLGSGTLDISVAIIERGSIKVKAVAGDTHLGGNDFDKRLVAYLLTKFEAEHEMCISSNSKSMRKLTTACEKAKRILSTNTVASIEIDSLIADIDFNYIINRDKFEELNKDYFERCIKLVEKCINDSKMDRGRIHEIILVGGSARIPKLQQMLQDFFSGKELCKSVNPDEIIACGAAIRAATRFQASNSSPQRLELNSIAEVNPYSIAFQPSGYPAQLFIRENTSIPVHKDFLYRSTQDFQHEMTIRFWAEELLGYCTIRDFPLAQRGEFTIRFLFLVDADGIMNVFMVNGRNGRGMLQLRLTYNGRRLNLEEIKNLIYELGKLKEESDKHKNRAIAKNALEDYLYKMSLFINDERAKSVLSPSEKEKIDEVVTKGTMWLEDSHDKITEAGKFDEKLKSLEDLLASTILADKNREVALNPAVKKIFGRAPGGRSN